MVDNVEITVLAGKGGDGAVTLHREKFAPRGGPDGGDGGNGGDVVIEADSNIDDLSRFRAQQSFRAQKGQPGGSNKKSGKNGETLVIGVPVGTLVRDIGRIPPVLLADLLKHGDRVLVASGGRGGWGNMHFATPSRQVPMEAKPGAPGEELRLELELRLAADIALVGPPNTGKSSLLKAVSRAQPVVADYPFATREPVLATVDFAGRSVVLVELPGIVPGSHQGKGLGNKFLRHAQRASAIVYLLAGDSQDPVGDFVDVRGELFLYDDSLKAKPQLVAVNKADLPSVRGRMPSLKRKFQGLGVQAHFVSALSGRGARELIEKAAQAAESAKETQTIEQVPEVIFRPKPKVRKSE